MARIIALTNQKGGVGKTTTSCALASGLASKGNRVLGIDLDPQGNFGFSLGLDIEEGPTIYDLFKKQTNVVDTIRRTSYCDIIPSNILLSGAELEFNQPGREFILKEALSHIQNLYDFIIIDTPPALNVLTVNAYVTSSDLIIPMVPEILSLLGISQIKETIDNVRKSYNPDLNVLGILLTKFNKRTLLAREVEEMAQTIAKQLGTIVFEARIRASVTVAEAPAHGESIYEHSPKSNPSLDYTAFCQEVLDRISALTL